MTEAGQEAEAMAGKPVPSWLKTFGRVGMVLLVPVLYLFGFPIPALLAEDWIYGRGPEWLEIAYDLSIEPLSVLYDANDAYERYIDWLLEVLDE